MITGVLRIKSVVNGSRRDTEAVIEYQGEEIMYVCLSVLLT